MGKCAGVIPRERKWRCHAMTVDRHLIGDIGLAVLLALPTLALSRPQSVVENKAAATAPLLEQAALAERSSVERRFSLPG
jgi:hypothetical protein